MNIDYVLMAHGLFSKKGGGSEPAKPLPEVTDLTSSSTDSGLAISWDWVVPTQSEFMKVELYMSETKNIVNSSYETCVSSATKIYEGTENGLIYDSQQMKNYYYKFFCIYTTFGDIEISKGVGGSIFTEIKKTPKPVTNISADPKDGKVNLTWDNPPSTDNVYYKTLGVYKEGSYPESVSDGITFVDSTENSISVTGLTNDTTYYFRFFTYTINHLYNEDVSQEISSTPSTTLIYGVKINTKDSNPLTSVSYIDNSIGMIPASSDWDNKFPFNEIKPVKLLGGTVVYELDKNDYNKKTNGEPSSPDKYMTGDIMVKFPKIYWNIQKEGDYVYVRYSSVKVDDSYDCLAHKRGDIEKDFLYIGAYLSKVFDDGGGKLKLCSSSGEAPTVSLTIDSFRTRAKNKGVGYGLIAYYQILLMQILYLVRFKNLNSQSSLGMGRVSGASVQTGHLNDKGMYFGDRTSSLIGVKCHGIEDLWGNKDIVVDGVRTDTDANVFVGTDNFNDQGTGYEKVGKSTGLSGYISGTLSTTKSGFFPTSTNGSSTTYYSDYTSVNGNTLVRFGGNNSSGDEAGIFCLKSNLSTTTTGTSIASRIIYL
ncbi:fibronectin type III domain-containing protein [Bacillus massiliigorillae]|uniref:fibronectin type III domain-containing protein n=1 Tax=Bacillus massiliigorillae TaxID=1243664 RepID=UPI00039A8187|nr:fibronectin type III domain-containing protein [Bacillus massiliigorillae]